MKDVREFFVRRFKREPESDPLYFAEWVYRFNTGDPVAYMDSEGRRVYESLTVVDR